MVKVIQEDEEMGTNSSHCNEELILEGPKMESSKAMPIIQEDTMPNVPLMPVNMEITSIEDFKVYEESQVESKGDIEQTEEYYDASDEFSFEEEIKTLKAKVTKREQRRMKRLQRAMLKLRDGRQVQITLGVKPYGFDSKVPSNHTQETEENDSVEEDQSHNLEGKRQYLQMVGADDCLKEKVTKCYLLQIQDVQVRSKQSNASGNNHYHLKMKSKQTKALKLPEKFEDCQEE